MEWKDGNYKISNDKSLLSVERICDLLSKSYWASKRPKEVIEKSIANSICYGVYYNEEQIGYARIITDYATTYYICDVILDEKHRGRGLGKKLINCMLEFEEVCSNFGMLATKDAHGLYEKYGFIRDEKSFLYKIPNK